MWCDAPSSCTRTVLNVVRWPLQGTLSFLGKEFVSGSDNRSPLAHVSTAFRTVTGQRNKLSVAEEQILRLNGGHLDTLTNQELQDLAGSLRDALGHVERTIDLRHRGEFSLSRAAWQGYSRIERQFKRTYIPSLSITSVNIWFIWFVKNKSRWFCRLNCMRGSLPNASCSTEELVMSSQVLTSILAKEGRAVESLDNRLLSIQFIVCGMFSQHRDTRN